eukprot:s639_g1.t1
MRWRWMSLLGANLLLQCFLFIFLAKGASPRLEFGRHLLAILHSFLRLGVIFTVLFLVFASFTSAYLVMGSRLPLRALIEKVYRGLFLADGTLESSGRGALPGWVTRAEPDIAAAGAREPAEAPAPVAPASGQVPFNEGLPFYLVLACSATGASEVLNLTQLLGWPAEGTSSGTVNQLFNMGLQLIYNFDQRNAKLVFQEASRLSHHCALCSWGFAHACGPTLNAPSKSRDDQRAGALAAQEAVQQMERRPEIYSAKEQVLIRSMAQRYEAGDASGRTAAVRYAERLRSLREEMNLLEDIDLKVFLAEALMLQLCTPNEWHFYQGEGVMNPPLAMPQTVESTKLLREVLEVTNQTHPYAQHLLIHSTEMSNVQAETALTSAEHLLANTAKLQDQHLQHMTSHTYLRTGRYHQALLSNVVAVRSDDAYLQHHWMPYGPGHNSVFLVCCALWGGEKAEAYKYVQVAQKVFTRAPGQSDFPDGSMAWNYPLLVALRFGEWRRVASLEREPPEPWGAKWVYGGPFLSHFARGIAAAHLGDAAEAAEHLTQLRRLMPQVEEEGKYTNESLIANHTASAVLALAGGVGSAALEALAAAVKVEMAMPYGLPPNWLLPTRECYGQALLRAERFGEAEDIFRQALEADSFHAEPKCGWALLGLRRSLAAQKRDLEVEAVDKEIAEAWKFADVPLNSPCSLIDLGPPAVAEAATSGRGASACKAWAGCDNWAKAPAPPAPKPLAPAVPVAPAVFEVLDAGAGSALKKASNKMKLPEPQVAPPPPKADPASPTSPASSASPRPPPQAPVSPSSPAEVVPPPPPPMAESGTGARNPRNEEIAAAPEQVKKGRLRSFLLEKGFGFISLEDVEVDVFVHVSTFEGQKPNDFPGLPGLPPVGQEVEFTVSEGHARPRAAWARITGPALPMDGSKVLCKSLGYVLQRPERYLDFRYLVKGWATLLHVLQHDLLKTAIEALAPEGAQKLSQGVLPEAVLAAIEDLAVCVVAPNAEAANEKIAAEGQDQFNFHVWLQQEAFLSDEAVPEAERLWIRHASRARSEEMRYRREETHPEDKPWWQGGGDTAAGAAEWEPHHLKASHLNPSSDSC